MSAPRLQFRYVLKHLREAAGLSQSELAQRARVNAVQLTHYEQGRQLPSLPVAVKLARAFGVSLDLFADCPDVSGEVESDRPRELAVGFLASCNRSPPSRIISEEV